MKKIMIAAVVLATVGLVSWTTSNNSEEGVKAFNLDQTKSSLAWKADYVADGHSHSGTVNISSGAMLFKGKKFKSGAFEVDLTTMTNTDLSEEKKPMLIGHLKSPDFFNVEKFAKVPVVIKSMTDTEIKATITVLGKAIDATMPVTVVKGSDVVTAKGKFSIDFAATNMNGFKAGKDKPADARVNSVISFDLNLVLTK